MFLMLIGQKVRKNPLAWNAKATFCSRVCHRMMRVRYRKRLVAGESRAVISQVDRILANEALGQCLRACGLGGNSRHSLSGAGENGLKSSPFRF